MPAITCGNALRGAYLENRILRWMERYHFGGSSSCTQVERCVRSAMRQAPITFLGTRMLERTREWIRSAILSLAGDGTRHPSGRFQAKRKSSAPVSPVRPFGRRVRSWLRMNAGGAPNTCKSNGTPLRGEASGERLSNAWRTCPPHGDSRGKPRVIPGGPAGAHAPAGIAQAVGDGSATHQVDGGATAHRADDG